MHWRLERFRDRLIHRQVFACSHDIALYKQARYDPKALAGPVRLHLRQGGAEPLMCRPGTTDPKVLWDTFHHRYHLPPRGVRPTGWILDLGANVGYTVAHFCWRYPKARVIAVEMDAENVAVCAQNIAGFQPRCELLHAAVWSADGEVRYGGDEAWSLRVSALDADAASPAKSAPAMTLDNILDRFAVETVDYLKMDIEGAEAVVLREPGTWAQRVQAMKVEIHPPATTEECRRLLASYGFRCANDTAHSKCIVAVR